MLQKIGLVIIFLGVMAADSPSLLAPMSLLTIGSGLYLIGKRLEERKWQA